MSGGQPVRVMNVEGDEVPVKFSGSIVNIATVSTNTIITAGSTVHILPRGKRTDYKSYRVSARFSATVSANINVFDYPGDVATTIGLNTVVIINTASYGSGEGRIDSDWTSVGILNSGASDITLTNAVVLGVR